MYECFHCLSHSVTWDGDFDTEDYGWEPGGVVHVCHCNNCGAEIQYVIMPGGVEDEDGDLDGPARFDEVDRYENCTVEVFRDSETGKTSHGWYLTPPKDGRTRMREALDILLEYCEEVKKRDDDGLVGFLFLHNGKQISVRVDDEVEE